MAGARLSPYFLLQLNVFYVIMILVIFMKKLVSVLLSLILIFSVISVTITTYAEEWNEEKSINNFIDGIVGLSREYDADKEFEIIEDEYTDNITVNQFYSNGVISETEELNSLDFQTARLIVRANDNFDDYGALEHVSGFEDFHILQYGSPKAAESAYQDLKNSNKIESVHPDAILSNIRKSDVSDSNQISTDTSTILCDWSLDRTQSKRLQDYLSESNEKWRKLLLVLLIQV